MKKVFYLFLTVILLISISSLNVAQASDPLNIQVTGDTFSNEAYPDRDFSTAGSVVLSQTPTNREGYFLFEGITLPESAILQTVYFNFYISDFDSGADSATLEFRNISTEWSENTLNWDNKPSTSGSLNSTVNMNSGWKKVDITTLAQDWYGIYMINNGVYVRATQPDMSITIASANSSNIPFLEIGYIIDMPTPPVECPLNILSPDDGSEISNQKPSFRWDSLTCLSSDIAEVRLIVNQISDDGDDSSEVINIPIPVDSTFFTPTEDLDHANYRWYIATLNPDGIGINKSESNGFTINKSDKEAGEDNNNATDTNTEEKNNEDTSAVASNNYILMYIVLIVCLIVIVTIVTILFIKSKKNNPKPPLQI